MKADKCAECVNWVVMGRPTDIACHCSHFGVDLPVFQEVHACRFGERPSTCVEFKAGKEVER